MELSENLKELWDKLNKCKGVDALLNIDDMVYDIHIEQDEKGVVIFHAEDAGEVPHLRITLEDKRP